MDKTAGQKHEKAAKAKEVVAHEAREYLSVFLLLTPFLLSFAGYRMYLQNDFREPFLGFGMAIVNSLVLSKIILIGGVARLGSTSRSRPLLVITIHKSAVFTLFYLFFHFLETGLRAAFHGESFWQAARTEVFTHLGSQVIRMLFVFFAFMPFFALRELRLVIGAARFRELFIGSGHHRETDSQGGSTQLQPGPAR